MECSGALDEKRSLLSDVAISIQGYQGTRSKDFFPTSSIIKFNNPAKIINAQPCYYQDTYYLLMKMDIAVFLISCLAFYGFVALLFSLVFIPDLDSISPPIKNFWEVFLFHIEFLTGLGNPHTASSIYLQMILSLESLIKVLVFSLITGLIFIRFTRPVARIRFSRNALITEHLGQRQFMFRVMHERVDALVNLHTELTLSLLEKLPEGSGLWRSFHSLPLRRSGIPSFSLPWTVMHVIDLNSKIYRMTSEDLYEASTLFTVVLNATDQITGGPVHAMHYYRPSDIIFDRKFDDCLTLMSDGTKVCDMSKFDIVKE